MKPVARSDLLVHIVQHKNIQYMGQNNNDTRAWFSSLVVAVGCKPTAVRLLLGVVCGTLATGRELVCQLDKQGFRHGVKVVLCANDGDGDNLDSVGF